MVYNNQTLEIISMRLKSNLIRKSRTRSFQLNLPQRSTLIARPQFLDVGSLTIAVYADACVEVGEIELRLSLNLVLCFL